MNLLGWWEEIWTMKWLILTIDCLLKMVFNPYRTNSVLNFLEIFPWTWKSNSSFFTSWLKSVQLVAAGECITINNFFRRKGNHIMTCLEVAYRYEYSIKISTKKRSTNIKMRSVITNSEISCTRKFINAPFFFVCILIKMKYSPLILFKNWTLFLLYI